MSRATDPHDYTDARGRNLCDTCDKWQGFASHREAATLDRIAPDELREAAETANVPALAAMFPGRGWEIVIEVLADEARRLAASPGEPATPEPCGCGPYSPCPLHDAAEPATVPPTTSDER